jgi:hypothetical protein
MKVYTLTQIVPSSQIWVYEVIANSEEEAIQMVKDGEAECIDYEVEGFGKDEISVVDSEDYKE